MGWRLKAGIQNTVSLLPSSASYAAYYWIQRHFGGLRRPKPIRRLTAALEIWQEIQRRGRVPAGKVFFEVGTGRVPLVPLAYWLMGAERTITIDLNPYLKAELVAENLQYISENKDEILNLFGSQIIEDRFDELLSFNRDTHFSLSKFLDLCHVDYIAPGDAAKTGHPDKCIDFHTSYTVLEHIRPNVLKQILEEGARIVKDQGLFVHRIDYSDHRSHSDKRLSAINFLRYSDTQWERLAGNRYMYANRLRHDDFIGLFESAGHHVVEAQSFVDRGIHESLKNGDVVLDARFAEKPEEVLAAVGGCIISVVPTSARWIESA